MNDKKYMTLALQLATATLGQTSPNPSVGAVLVKDGQIIGLGSHLFAGCPHAESYALSMHPELNAGATLYVTLEPCCHFGKTPPCVKAIIDAKIKRVVIATLDLNPLVNGHGVKQLKEAGIIVEVGVQEAEAIELNQKYFHYILYKTPYITLKAGMSLDGKLATVAGESKWITSAEARNDVHLYRCTHDAILVGVDTIIADNPALTSHRVMGGKNPIRIILDRNLRTPLGAEVVHDDESPTWIITNANVDSERIKPYLSFSHVKIIPLNTTNLTEIMQKLYALGINSILVEGGNKIHSSFLENKLINQLVIYMAPMLIGGLDAPHFFAGNGFSKLSEALNLKLESITTIGDNIKIIATLQSEK